MKKAFKLLKSFSDWWGSKETPCCKAKSKRKYKKRKKK